jgi:hypothetical protein
VSCWFGYTYIGSGLGCSVLGFSDGVRGVYSAILFFGNLWYKLSCFDRKNWGNTKRLS